MSAAPSSPQPFEGSISAFYEKANHFRVIHADGVYGGGTRAGNFHLAFYSERTPIPREVEFTVTREGDVSPEKVIESKRGLFRELEADVVMSLHGAVNFHTWLGNQLEIVRQQMGISIEDWRRLLSKRQP
jgi:hypothetical protein